MTLRSKYVVKATASMMHTVTKTIRKVYSNRNCVIGDSRFQKASHRSITKSGINAVTAAALLPRPAALRA